MLCIILYTLYYYIITIIIIIIITEVIAGSPLLQGKVQRALMWPLPRTPSCKVTLPYYNMAINSASPVALCGVTLVYGLCRCPQPPHSGY